MIRPGVRRLFRLRLNRREDVVRQVEDEIRMHIDLRAQQLIASGVPEHEAWQRAERRFGWPHARWELHRTATRRERIMGMRDWLDSLTQDIRFAAQALVREPLLAGMVIVTLALGIGANAVMFGIIDRLLLSGPEHVTNPDQVMRLYVTRERQGMQMTASRFGYVSYKLMQDVSAFDGVGAFTRSEEVVGTGAEAKRIWAGYATWDLFPTLGVKPLLGRFFTSQEDMPPKGHNVVVLSYEYWQREFNGARDVVGRTYRMRSGTYRIIGVAPPGFTGPQLEPAEVWIPMSSRLAPVDDWWESWNAWWLQVVVRLKPGVTPDQANALATASFRNAYTGRTPGFNQALLSVHPISYGDDGEETMEFVVARWLVGVSVVVLLIACANVANLLLARGIRRRREIAVRVALGIGRLRLVRLLMIESVLLAIAGGIAALAVAHWGGQFIRVVLLPNVYWPAAVLGDRVLVFSLLATVVTGILIGLVPALHAARQNLTPSLKTGVREGGVHRGRLRGALTGAQAALSVLLLIGSGLFIRSLYRINEMHLGVEPDRVLRISAELPSRGGEDWDARLARMNRFYFDAIDRLKTNPAVEFASASIGVPFYGSMGIPLAIPGRDSIPNMPGGGPYVQAVSSDYHHTVGTRLLRGRYFTSDDREGSMRVAIVNETMATSLWPAEDAVGKCLTIGRGATDCTTIVGIVEDARRTGLREERAFQYYVPLGQERDIGGPDLLVRPRLMNAASERSIARTLREVEPSLGYIDIEPLQLGLDPEVRPWKLGASMFTIFGGIALLIAAVGLYSVIAYGVVQRRTELGIRAALGARTSSLIRMVLFQAVAFCVAGLVIGMAAALAAGRFIEPLLFDIRPHDPVTYIAVALTLLLVAIAAGTVPAGRAGKVSPIEALRNE